MGLMFTASFALGVVIISKLASSTHLMHILFGNVLGVKHSALMLNLCCQHHCHFNGMARLSALIALCLRPSAGTSIGF